MHDYMSTLHDFKVKKHAVHLDSNWWLMALVSKRKKPRRATGIEPATLSAQTERLSRSRHCDTARGRRVNNST